MLKERHQIFVGLFVLADCLALGLAWLASYMIRFELRHRSRHQRAFRRWPTIWSFCR